MRGVDYDYELGNGWDEWQKVVLLGMREIREEVKETKGLATETDKKLAVVTEVLDRVEKAVANQDARLVIVETKSASRFAFVKGAWQTIAVVASSLIALSSLGATIAMVVANYHHH